MTHPTPPGSPGTIAQTSMDFTPPNDPTKALKMIDGLHREVVRTGRGVLFSISMPLATSSSSPWIPRHEDVPRMAWIEGSDGISFSGFGVAAALKASGPERFRQIERGAKRLFAGLKMLGPQPPVEVRPRLFGGFSFLPEPDPRSIWASFASGYFILPRYLLTRLGGDSWLTFSHLLRPDDDPQDIAWLLTADPFNFRAPENARPASDALSPTAIGWPEGPVEVLTRHQSWLESVQDATDRIGQGELQKVVLARVLRLRGADRFDPMLALRRLGDRYPDCYRFLFEPISGQAFFGATPEILVRVSGTSIQTDALAGSIARGASEREDAALARRLLGSPKERLEHDLVVREIQSSLDGLTGGLTFPERPEIRKLQNIQHLQTQIDGQLKRRLGVLRVAEVLHATPAVGGSPRDEALRLISKYESFSRGWYAAPIGWFDANLDGVFAVAIRSALLSGQELRLFAGAGIVAGSDPDQEWEETALKFRPVLEAVKGE